MHNIISGTWATKAQSYIDKTSKILNLVGYLQPYLHKDGLKDAKEDMILLIDYITDVAKGNYTDYNVNRLLIVIAALLYVIDPIDMVPDFFVGGFLDDVTVIGWAITIVAQELEDYKLYRPSNFDYLE